MCRYLFDLVISFPLDIYLEMGSLDHIDFDIYINGIVLVFSFVS